MRIMNRYRDLYKASLTDPAQFWAEAAREVTWTRSPQQILDDTRPPFYRWFPDAELNSCANALDRHVDAGRGGQAALIYDSPVTESQRTITYAELLDPTSRFAGALSELGVDKGDRVVIYMPMIPEAVIAMLACARIGAVHSVVFGGFAPHELATRIDDARPAVIVSASCGVEPTRVVQYKPMLDAAIEASAHPPRHCVIVQRDRMRCNMVDGRDHDWEGLIAPARPTPAVPVAATDPLYILYTSGTTGKPKGIVRDNGGHAVALLWSMRHIYDIGPGDVFWAASDVGWVVGHTYIVYGPLLAGATTVLYEGKPVGTPNPGAFWRVVTEHGVNVLFTAPTAVRAIRKDDPDGAWFARYDRASLRSLFFAGERLDPDTYHWVSQKLGIPVIDHWWQTQTGWAIAPIRLGSRLSRSNPGRPRCRCRATPLPSCTPMVVAADPVKRAQSASACRCRRAPSRRCGWTTRGSRRHTCASIPATTSPATADTSTRTAICSSWGRIDDVINVAGHRLSTGAMEAVLASHPAVAECAVIGVADEIKGQIPRGFVVLQEGTSAEGLASELVKLVRDEIGAVACLKQVDIVAALPKTLSSKILRKTMREIAHGHHGQPPSTIDDPDVLHTLRPVLRR